MTTKIEIKGALITLAKVWGIKNHSIESEDNTFTLIDKASGTVAKEYVGNKEEVYESVMDDMHEIVWTDKLDYNPALDAVRTI